jgi:hydroxymethylpyrimidine/phosphomethylpyrimidine kinase
MLADASIIRAVAEKIRQYQPKYVVLDPVMVATSGDLLLETSAIDALKAELLPLATVITPNLPEGAALLGTQVPQSQNDMEALIDQLRALNTAAILLKGGHLESDSSSNDLLITQDDVSIFETTRINTKNTHGTGCTLSSAIASYLAQNNTLHQAVSNGKSYITQAITHADELDIGKGHGPVHHFYALNR